MKSNENLVRLPKDWGRMEVICGGSDGHRFLPDAPECGCRFLRRIECSCVTCGDKHFTGETVISEFGKAQLAKATAGSEKRTATRKKNQEVKRRRSSMKVA